MYINYIYNVCVCVKANLGEESKLGRQDWHRVSFPFLRAVSIRACCSHSELQSV